MRDTQTKPLLQRVCYNVQHTAYNQHATHNYTSNMQQHSIQHTPYDITIQHETCDLQPCMVRKHVRDLSFGRTQASARRGTPSTLYSRGLYGQVNTGTITRTMTRRGRGTRYIFTSATSPMSSSCSGLVGQQQRSSRQGSAAIAAHQQSLSATARAIASATDTGPATVAVVSAAGTATLRGQPTVG